MEGRKLLEIWKIVLWTEDVNRLVLVTGRELVDTSVSFCERIYNELGGIKASKDIDAFLLENTAMTFYFMIYFVLLSLTAESAVL